MAQEATTLKTIEQGRAKYAFEKVKEISEDKSKKLKENYKSTAKKLPVLIKTNGLGQTLAFLKSKGEKEASKPKNAHDRLYDQISIWLQTEDFKGLVNAGELVEQIINLESHAYRQVTVETLALLNWMRRFVDGLMEDVKQTENNDA